MDDELIVADLADVQALEDCMQRHEFDAVMHFAESIQVEESIHNPLKYYQNNMTNGLNLLGVMQKYGVDKIIFSSSAAVYGQPQSISVSVDAQKNLLILMEGQNLFLKRLCMIVIPLLV